MSAPPSFVVRVRVMGAINLATQGSPLLWAHITPGRGDSWSQQSFSTRHVSNRSPSWNDIFEVPLSDPAQDLIRVIVYDHIGQQAIGEGHLAMNGLLGGCETEHWLTLHNQYGPSGQVHLYLHPLNFGVRSQPNIAPSFPSSIQDDASIYHGSIAQQQQQQHTVQTTTSVSPAFPYSPIQSQPNPSTYHGMPLPPSQMSYGVAPPPVQFHTQPVFQPTYSTQPNVVVVQEHRGKSKKPKRPKFKKAKFKVMGFKFKSRKLGKFKWK